MPFDITPSDDVSPRSAVAFDQSSLLGSADAVMFESRRLVALNAMLQAHVRDTSDAIGEMANGIQNLTQTFRRASELLLAVRRL